MILSLVIIYSIIATYDFIIYDVVVITVTGIFLTYSL